MAVDQDKFLPEIHQALLSILDKLAKQIEFDEPLSLAVMMPIISLARMIEPGNTLDQGGICLRQIAHCCRMLGMLDNTFYRTSPLFVHCQQAISELGHYLGWNPSAVTCWQNFAKGRLLQ